MNFLPFKTFCIVRLQNYLGLFCSGCRSTLCATPGWQPCWGNTVRSKNFLLKSQF